MTGSRLTRPIPTNTPMGNDPAIPTVATTNVRYSPPKWSSRRGTRSHRAPASTPPQAPTRVPGLTRARCPTAVRTAIIATRPPAQYARQATSAGRNPINQNRRFATITAQCARNTQRVPAAKNAPRTSASARVSTAFQPLARGRPQIGGEGGDADGHELDRPRQGQAGTHQVEEGGDRERQPEVHERHHREHLERAEGLTTNGVRRREQFGVADP